ncbi:MAG: redoxin domain-containing protein, partial [Thiobacillus sp.]|nr:redoxin domain-containing protein [Thiobacillus sp.]
IQAKYAGRPFILSLWSVNWCGHCITELTLLGQVAKTRKQLPLVLVSTDTTESSVAIEQTQKRLGLARVDSWVFDDDIPERLRQAIDPLWHGELPRTYLYDARHQREAVAGVLSEVRLRAWLERNR